MTKTQINTSKSLTFLSPISISTKVFGGHVQNPTCREAQGLGDGISTEGISLCTIEVLSFWMTGMGWEEKK